MAAGEAEPQVDPAVPGPQAFLASCGSAGLDSADLVQMAAGGCHGELAELQAVFRGRRASFPKITAGAEPTGPSARKASLSLGHGLFRRRRGGSQVAQ